MRKRIGKNKEEFLPLQRFLNCLIDKRECSEIKATFVNVNQSHWTKEQDKAFEKSFATYGMEPNDRWEIIAAALTGKTRQEIKNHYKLLLEDVNCIESGNVPLPNYVESGMEDTKNEDKSAVSQSGSTRARRGSRGEKERKRGIAWSKEEHRQFLKGLDSFGRGDWRSISRHCVRSRTPTQVASHAQKYYHRLNSGTKQRKRNSIHDVTREDEEETSAPQGPAGEMIGGASASASSAITENSPPLIPPPVLMNEGDMSGPFGYTLGSMNEASAGGLYSVVAGQSSPFIDCPIMGPPSLPPLPSPTETIYGFDAPVLDEWSSYDISDVPFF